MFRALLDWMSKVVQRFRSTQPPSTPEPEGVDPTPEMTGETWAADNIPPERDPRVVWYHKLSPEKLWDELFTRENRQAALVVCKRRDLSRGYFGGKVLISDEELQKARQMLLEIPGVRLWDGPRHEVEMPKMPDGRAYPAVAVWIQDLEALRRILEQPTFEVVEPLFVAQDGIGCDLAAYTPNSSDGEMFGNVVPWTFNHLGVLKAWDLYKTNNAYYDPGYPIRIGVIDTGVFQDEHQLTDDFNANSVRSLAHHLTVVQKAWDDCGHGTRIAGLATAPLDTQSLNPVKIVGVAWGADLTTVKYNSGVVAFAGSRAALVTAIQLAIDDGAKVVNLALGMPYWSPFVYDYIAMLFDTTQTIFVCAAGTFVPNVTFPASMAQVIAVGIVKSKNPADPEAGYDFYNGPAPESAYGPEVDIVAVNGEGDVPTTGGGAPDGGFQALTTIGGSSSGTAHVSGILALAWGKQPSATRQQVIGRLLNSASLRLIWGEETLTPGTSSHVGYGIPDAYLAAGGSRRLSISGPSSVLPGSTYTLSAFAQGWLPLNYVWSTGEHSSSVAFTAAQFGTASHSVTATNPIDGSVLTAQHQVLVAPTHKRILYADPVIVRYPPYPFAGGTYDLKINYGVTVPVGCAVLSVLGQKVDYVNGSYQNVGPPLAYLSLALKHGFSMARAAGVGPRNLNVDARVWHSGTNAIRVKVHYLIAEPDGVDANVPGSTVHGYYPQ